jgi:hypothetical protein
VQRLLAQYGDAKMPDLLTVLPNCPQGSASQSPELESCCCVFGLGGAQRYVSIMTKVAYEVTPAGDQWLVTRDGQPGMSYVSQEAAYEVAVADAGGDLRSGNEVRIEVVGNAYKRTGDGSSPAAGAESGQE